MKRKILLFAFLLILLVACSKSIEKGVVKPQKLPQSICWKVYNDNCVVYMLGSIHFADKSFYPLPAHINKAFEESQILAVEADITNTSIQPSGKLFKKTMLPTGSTLKSKLLDKEYKKLAEALQKLGLNINLFNQFKPWAIAMNIELMQAMKLGLNPSLGIDFTFLTKAKNNNIEIQELEGIEYQINLFDSFDEDLQKEFLMQYINKLDEKKDDLQLIANAWKSGDDIKISHILNKEANNESTKALYKKLLYDRNIKMTAKIEKYLTENKNVFVIVGAGHLVGDKGIIKLLEKNGFRVKRL